MPKRKRNPYSQSKDYGQLLYNGERLETGAWAYLEYKKKELLKDPTINPKLAKITNLPVRQVSN